MIRPVARATEGKAGRRSGFTLVELLVAIGVFALLYAGVHGLFTSTWSAWRRNRERAEAYQVGITLVDSITRDVRNARDATGTSAVTSGSYGNDLRLVLNYPARPNPGGGFDQKRVTYELTADGFKRTIQTAVTPTATAALSSGTLGPTQEWILSRAVTNFQFEQYPTFLSATYPLNQRIIRFFLTVETGSGRVQLNGRAFIRRSPQLNANQDGFSYE